MAVQNKTRSPWAWIPSLYLAEGLPYVAVNIVSVIMYKRMGISNADIALYTSLLYLPWVIKPIWSPLVDHAENQKMVDSYYAACSGTGFCEHRPYNSGITLFQDHPGVSSGCWHSVQPPMTLLQTVFTCSG